ncbi:MAG: hypothetical protein GXY83_42435 [Rhodopirellula sp.]|nr:hypothetical protein [Rhodopirellula sp.]
MNLHLRAIESEYGKAAAVKALGSCDRYSELLEGSMVHDLRSILTPPISTERRPERLTTQLVAT